MHAAVTSCKTPSEAPSERRAKALVALAGKLQTYGYGFTTVTPLTHAYNNERQGNRWAEDLRDVFGWSRPFLRELVAPDDFDLMLQAGILRPWAEGWRSSIRWSSLGDLLLSHSAYPTSSAESVFFGPDTYRFVNAVQDWLNNHQPALVRAADVGCGSGAGAIALARSQPRCEVVAVDINPQALHMTRINAQVAAVGNVIPKLGSLLDDVEGTLDLIIANPPYMMDAQERAYRHGGGELGAGLSIQIVEQALGKLAKGGTLLLYTGVAMVRGTDPFRAQLQQLLHSSDCHWQYQELDPDVFSEELRRPEYASVERIAAILLTLTLN
ncbi:class I SAM-dependent methyltransferase [Halopseudomonas pelagia]|uniref:class I SAM-dependent methyltransferase n=1 Tax=Halopseudomonas pelagia TaxID=553151 RepID=UPI0030DDDAF0|tara:strand:+ start:6156 stop:7133 length:978 start_codon:yes stop_codon:yes gene_type:complete